MPTYSGIGSTGPQHFYEHLIFRTNVQKRRLTISKERRHNLLIHVALSPARSTGEQHSERRRPSARWSDSEAGRQWRLQESTQRSTFMSVQFHAMVSSLCLTMESHFPLTPSVLPYLGMTELLYFLRMLPVTSYMQIVLYLRRLSDEQEPEHGLQSGGAGESPFPRLRTPSA